MQARTGTPAIRSPSISPIPSLALHFQYDTEKDPYIDWKSWWDLHADNAPTQESNANNITVREAYEKSVLTFDKWEPYFDVYEKYFKKFKNQSPTFVEVGVSRGGSIEAWVHYFGPGAKIYGIDKYSFVSEVQGATLRGEVS